MLFRSDRIEGGIAVAVHHRERSVGVGGRRLTVAYEQHRRRSRRGRIAVLAEALGRDAGHGAHGSVRPVKLGYMLGYWGSGPPVGAQDALVEAERLGYDSAWTAEAYGSDALSGVAVAPTLQVVPGTPSGNVTPYTATCSGAQDRADNVAAPASVSYAVRNRR